jgi:hypothetical protein
MPPILISNRMMDLFIQERRSPGKHVSTAIHNVMAALHPDRFGGGGDGDEGEDEEQRLVQARFNLGNAMEEVIVQALAREYPGQYVRPGALELDNITGTPDLWDVHRPATVEIKLTWASASRAEDIEDAWFWRYWSQLMAYAKMANMTVGQLIIVFVNGNYKRGAGGMPASMMWEWEFTQEELDDNWRMIVANAGGEDE